MQYRDHEILKIEKVIQTWDIDSTGDPTELLDTTDFDITTGSEYWVDDSIDFPTIEEAYKYIDKLVTDSEVNA